MQMSAAGLDLLQELEGVETEPYRDSAGLLTVGCGHLLTKDELSSGKITCSDRVIRWKDGPLTGIDIDLLLLQDVQDAATAVNTAVTVSLTQPQFDALVCFTFNVGVGAFRQSTLCRRLNAGEYDAVPDELRRWNRAGGQVIAGLVRRREREITHWAAPVSSVT